VPEQPASIFIGALTPGIKQKATSVQLSNPSYGLLESGKVGQQKKKKRKKRFTPGGQLRHRDEIKNRPRLVTDAEEQEGDDVVHGPEEESERRAESVSYKYRQTNRTDPHHGEEGLRET
jgi:hypothetical protein